MAKITESNTKKEIFEAYKEVLSKLQELESTKVDPVKEVAAKKAVETLEKASQTASQSVEDQIASLQKNIAGILGNLSNSFSEEIKKFQTIQEAIKLKEEELKELLGIEKEAFALVALINTQQELKNKFDAEMAEKREKALVELAEINKQMQEARILASDEIKTLKEQYALQQKREQEQYEYDFNRRKQKDLDELNDTLKELRKAFDERIEADKTILREQQKALDERESLISKREEKMNALEAEVAAFPEREAQIKAEIEDKVRKEEAKVSAIKEAATKREFESQKVVLENKVSMLEEALEQERAKHAETARKLDEAYDKMQKMALASVQSSNESKAFQNIERMLTDKTQK